jgi:arylsulfatase A-like enzyme
MTDNRPNVLLFVVDCLRGDRAYGDEGDAIVPVIDSLKERGFTFETSVSSASNTTPSFSSLLTSIYGFRHGVRSLRGYRLKDEIPTLGEAFQAAGYKTYAEVSGPLRKENGLNRGFDEYVYREKGMSFFSSFLKKAIRRVSSEMGTPWFLLLHLWELHRPRKIRRGWNRPEYGETYYDRSLSSIDERMGVFLEQVPENTIIVFTGDHGERMNEGDEHPENWRYAARIPALENFTEVRHHNAKRKKQRRAKRAGKEVGPLGGACHGFHVYEDLVRVPLIFAGPGIPKGSANGLVRHIDVGRTLLEMLDIPEPEGFGVDARSLVPAFKGEELKPEPAYFEATGANLKSPTRWIAGVRTETLKYTRGLMDDDMPEEFYDLEADPTEQENLAGRDDRMEDMKRLFDAMVGDKLRDNIEVTLSEEEIEDLDETLRSLGYLE